MVTHTIIPLREFDRLAKSMAQACELESIEFSHDRLVDDFGPLFRRIVAAHSERRDEVVWAYGLRGERPEGIGYRKGLSELVLTNNKFGDGFVRELVRAISYDTYLLKLDLRSNRVDKLGVAEAVSTLDQNKSLVNLDLRDNPGYDPVICASKISKRLVANIKRYKKNPELYNLIDSRGWINAVLLPLEGTAKNKTDDKKRHREGCHTESSNYDMGFAKKYTSITDQETQTGQDQPSPIPAKEYSVCEEEGCANCKAMRERLRKVLAERDHDLAKGKRRTIPLTKDREDDSSADDDIKKKIEALLGQLTELMGRLEKRKKAHRRKAN